MEPDELTSSVPMETGEGLSTSTFADDRRRVLALEDVRKLLMKAHRDNDNVCKEHPISVSVADFLHEVEEDACALVVVHMYKAVGEHVVASGNNAPVTNILKPVVENFLDCMYGWLQPRAADLNPPTTIKEARKRHLQRLVRWIVPKVFLAFGFLADMAGRKSITTDIDEIAATAILRTIARKTEMSVKKLIMDNFDLIFTYLYLCQEPETRDRAERLLEHLHGACSIGRLHAINARKMFERLCLHWAYAPSAAQRTVVVMAVSAGVLPPTVDGSEEFLAAEAVSAFMHHRQHYLWLVVLHMRRALGENDAEMFYSSNARSMILRSFGILCKNLAGTACINTHYSKLFMVLRTASMHRPVFGRDAYDAELVNAWHSYLQSVQAQILTEQIADIVPLLVACPIETMDSILHYLFEESGTQVGRLRKWPHWRALCFVLVDNCGDVADICEHKGALDAQLQVYARKEVLLQKYTSLEEEINACLDLIALNRSHINHMALKKINRLLSRGKGLCFMQSVLSERGNERSVRCYGRLTHTLIDLLHEHDYDVQLTRRLVVRLLGTLGAVELSRVPPLGGGDEIVESLLSFVRAPFCDLSRDSSYEFIACLLRRLVRQLLSSLEEDHHDLCCLTVQRTLNALENEKSFRNKIIRALSQGEREIVMPLSRAEFGLGSTEGEMQEPEGAIYPKCKTHHEWLSKVIRRYCRQLDAGDERLSSRLLVAASTLAHFTPQTRSGEDSGGYLRWLLPHVIMHALHTERAAAVEQFLVEIKAVFREASRTYVVTAALPRYTIVEGCGSPPPDANLSDVGNRTLTSATIDHEMLLAATQTLLYALETMRLHVLALSNEKPIGESRSECTPLSYKHAYSKNLLPCSARQKGACNQFLGSVSGKELGRQHAHAAALVHSYERAVQIMEQLIRSQQQGIDGYADSKDMADMYADLQQLYYRLNDVDGVLGATQCIKRVRHANSREEALSHEVIGNYHDSMHMYEVAISQLRKRIDSHGTERSPRVSADEMATLCELQVRLAECRLRLNQVFSASCCLSGLEPPAERGDIREHISSARAEVAIRAPDWSYLVALAEHRRMCDNRSGSDGCTFFELIAAALGALWQMQATGVNEWRLVAHRCLSAAYGELVPGVVHLSRNTRNWQLAYGQVVRCHAVHDIELAVEFVSHNRHLSQQNDRQHFSRFLTVLRDRIELTEYSLKARHLLLEIWQVIGQALTRGKSRGSEQSVNNSTQLPVRLGQAILAREEGQNQTAWSLLTSDEQPDVELSAESITYELEIARLQWERQNQAQAIRSLERLVDTHWASIINTTQVVDAQLRNKMIEVRALLAEYTKQSAGAPVHVVQEHFEIVAKASNTEEHYYKLAMYYDDEKEPSDVTERANYYGRITNAYLTSLTIGSRYCMHSLPRVLTILGSITRRGPYERINDKRARVCKRVCETHTLSKAEEQDMEKHEKEKKQKRHSIESKRLAQLRKKMQSPNNCDYPYVPAAMSEIVSACDKRLKQLPTWMLYSVLSQLISTIRHPNCYMSELTQDLICSVVCDYPYQSLWFVMGHLVSARLSELKIDPVCSMFRKIQEQTRNNKPSVWPAVRAYDFLIEQLHELAKKPTDKRRNTTKLKLQSVQPKIYELFERQRNGGAPSAKRMRRESGGRPSRDDAFGHVLMPIESQLSPTLPSDYSADPKHRAFDDSKCVFIADFVDNVDIFQSMQRPRKLTCVGSDGKHYAFLLKRGDDLRKDERAMQLFRAINRCLTADAMTRARQLRVRTYQVLTFVLTKPLDQSEGGGANSYMSAKQERREGERNITGIIEWVPNLTPLRQIIDSLEPTLHYEVVTQRIQADSYHMTRPISTSNRDYRNHCQNKLTKRFLHECGEEEKLAVYQQFANAHCPVLYEHFTRTYAEPSAWLSARQRFVRSYAVMCVIGYMIGLGDRHLENILLDECTGEVVHVDYAHIFDSAWALAVPELVPFRLTPNIVDAFGPVGIEGVFRLTCEHTARVLRANKRMLMTQMQAFIDDPLISLADHFAATEERLSSMASCAASGGVTAQFARPLATQKYKSGPLINKDKPTAAQLLNIARVLIEQCEQKLSGAVILEHWAERPTTVHMSVPAQIDALIHESKEPKILAQMYHGWTPWL